MPKPETITSAANPLLKQVRRAILRGTLTADGYCVVETFHLLEEALRANCEVGTVLAAESVQAAAEAQVGAVPGIRVVVLPDRLLQNLSGTESAQGVIALVRPPEWRIGQLFQGCPLVVVLDGLQDPGNAGAIARTAEAFGATGLLLLKGTVSPFNSKTLRASAGSLFRVPFLHGVDAPLARTVLEQNKTGIYASVPAAPGGTAMLLAEIDLTRPCALVIGSEGHGVSDQMRRGSVAVSIPTVGVESLNAAVAAAILLYEARRQRSRRA